MNLTQAAEALQRGEKLVKVRPKGNSMFPKIKSGEEVTLWGDFREHQSLRKGLIVLAKVRGNLYLHQISAVEGNRVQISNNHGHVNGWTTQDKVYGIVLGWKLKEKHG